MIAFRADLDRLPPARTRARHLLPHRHRGSADLEPSRATGWVLSIPDGPGRRRLRIWLRTVRGVLGVPGLPMDVLGSNHWTAARPKPHPATFTRRARFFLTGDAAHRFPACRAATGVSGRDARCAQTIAWKIAARPSGAAPEAGRRCLDKLRGRARTGRATQRHRDRHRLVPGLSTRTGAPLRRTQASPTIDMGYQYRSPAHHRPTAVPTPTPPGTDYRPVRHPRGCRAPAPMGSTPLTGASPRSGPVRPQHRPCLTAAPRQHPGGPRRPDRVPAPSELPIESHVDPANPNGHTATGVTPAGRGYFVPTRRARHPGRNPRPAHPGAGEQAAATPDPAPRWLPPPA